MLTDERIQNLIGGIYDAAVDRDLWPAWLDEVADAIGGAATTLVFSDLPSLDAHLSAHVRFDGTAAAAYEEYYAGVDVRVQRAYQRPGFVRAGLIINDPPAVISEQELIATEIYNDFLLPNGIFHTLVGVFARTRFRGSSIASMRPRSQPAFEFEAQSVLRELTPHLARAFKVHGQIVELQSVAAAASDALDRWRAGWIVVDLEGRIIRMNRAAKCLVDRRDGLEVWRGALSARMASDAATLRALTRKAAERPGIGGSMLVKRGADRRPLQLLASPFRFHSALGEAKNGRAMLFVIDPESEIRVDRRMLREVFGLTPAESRMAEKLIQGKDLRAMAEELEIRLCTARDHLKHIRHKTGTRRQAETVRALLAVTADIHPLDEGC